MSFLVFIGIINFYLILDWEKIGPLLHRMIPERHRPRVVEVLGIGVLLAFFMALQAVEGYVLQPRIVGRGAGLHPLLVLLALMVGYQFGLGGMIIAVPAASVVRVLVHEFYWRPYVEDGNRPRA
jgi:predicted PurR-regulated permease PerM